MKVKCISDTKRFLGQDVEGLTKGKVYDAEAVSRLQGQVDFFIFNDDKKWKTYDTSLFVPEDK